MPPVALVVLAGTESPSDLGRVVNALQTTKEFDEHDDEVELIFDGAGTQWVPELSDENHDYHPLFAAVEHRAQACAYCANVYGVEDGIAESDVSETEEFEGHPSMRSLVSNGYEIVTY